MRERLLEVRTKTALQQVVEVDAKAFDSGQLRRQAQRQIQRPTLFSWNVSPTHLHLAADKLRIYRQLHASLRPRVML